jgi:hypothetical protein
MVAQSIQTAAGAGARRGLAADGFGTLPLALNSRASHRADLRILNDRENVARQLAPLTLDAGKLPLNRTTFTLSTSPRHGLSAPTKSAR